LPPTISAGRHRRDFPAGAPEQAEQIINLLDVQRDLNYVAIGLFLLEQAVRTTSLRTAFGALAQGTGKQIRSQSKSNDPSKQAAAAADAILRTIRRNRRLREFRNHLGHEGEPAPDHILRRAFKSFFLVFLTGKTRLGEAEAGLRDLVKAATLVPALQPTQRRR
jgi:hypothetical protein